MAIDPSTLNLPPKLPPAVLESFKLVIDSIGTFHPKTRDWNLPQKLLLTELGIEEARLLAWGDSIGVNGPPRLRVAPPDPPFVLTSDLIDNISGTLNQLVKFQTDLVGSSDVQKSKGLKSYPYGKHPEPALDSNRMEAFLEKQRRLRMLSGKGQSLKHYSINDDVKFRASYLDSMRQAISHLIKLTHDDEFVEAALIQDIKAMAWHPVFEPLKAAHDSQKLQMIKQCCRDIYPVLSDAAAKALGHLSQEWQDNDEEMAIKHKPHMEKERKESYARKSIVPGSAASFLPGLHHRKGDKDGTKSGVDGGTGEKKMAGVFSRIFRRRSIHNTPNNAAGAGANGENKVDEGASNNAQRSRSV